LRRHSDHSFLTTRRYDRQPRLASLDAKERIRRIFMRKDDLPIAVLANRLAWADLSEENL
jgi:hypothetical protein